MDYLYLYAAVLVLVLVFYVRRQKRVHASHHRELKENVEAGLVEPASLHPVINPARCIGSGSCAAACPEDALGMVNGKAVLKNASACIGHGACMAACPVAGHQPGVRHRAPRDGHPEHQCRLRDQCAGHLHRWRTGRHGTGAQGCRAGPPGHGGDSQAPATPS